MEKLGADVTMNLLDYFRISKTISFKDGEILLMNQNVNVTPTSILCDFQKGLIENIGFKESYENLYNTANKISYDYNSKFIKGYKFKSERDVTEWQIKVVTLAGWGKWTIKHFEPEKYNIIFQMKNSPFTKVYGKSGFPVDIITAGLVAGGALSNFKKPIEAIETKCQAMGDEYCQIEIGIPEAIEAKKKELWAKWKLI